MPGMECLGLNPGSLSGFVCIQLAREARRRVGKIQGRLMKYSVTVEKDACFPEVTLSLTPSVMFWRSPMELEPSWVHFEVSVLVVLRTSVSPICLVLFLFSMTLRDDFQINGLFP